MEQTSSVHRQLRDGRRTGKIAGAVRRGLCNNALKMLFACAVLVCSAPQAAIVGDYSNRKIIEVYGYSDYGGGDFTFRVDVPVAGCEGGFWLRPTDPGFKANVTLIMLAHTNKANVRVWGHNDQLWSGSVTPTCRLYAVGLA